MKLVDAIGGYFQLELPKSKEYYSTLVKVNTGRNALEYILLARQYKKVYIPYFTCNVILEPFKRQGIEYEFYNIDFNLEIIGTFQLKQGEAILYTNYFGLKTNYISKLCQTFNNLIVDNAQAFFCKPFSGADTFYSPRKFFGLPDGGYVATTGSLDQRLLKDQSAERCSHLLLRLDKGAEEGYQAYQESDKSLSGQPIKQMSDLTYSLLCSINYESAREKRNTNFQQLHNELQQFNELNWINESIINGPMIYPFYDKKGIIRKELIKEKVFTATYWPNVLEENALTTLEYDLASKIISLPIDQRYNATDMAKILKIVKKYK
jgi:hypothetical protein